MFSEDNGRVVCLEDLDVELDIQYPKYHFITLPTMGDGEGG